MAFDYQQAPPGMMLSDVAVWNVEHGLVSGPDYDPEYAAGGYGADHQPDYVAPDWVSDPNSEFNKPAQFQQQTNLDDWYAAHNGGARYAVYNGVTIDNAALAYAAVKANVANGSLPNVGTGLNADLDAELAGAVAKASAAVAYGATHGGWTPETNPNALPIVIPTDPNYVAVVPVPPGITDIGNTPPVIGDPLAPPTPGLIPTVAQATAGSSMLVPLFVVGALLALAWYFRGRL